MKKNLIINFHNVRDSIWFENVILYLKSKYTLVNLSFFEDLKNYKKEKGFCHITFDDGNMSFYTVAYPILMKYSVPTTLFVSPKSAVECKNFWFQEISDYDKNTILNIISKELELPLRVILKISPLHILKCLSFSKIKKIIYLYQKKTKISPKGFLNMGINEILEVEKSGLITIGAHTLNHPILKNECDEDSEKEITRSIVDLQKILGHSVRYFAYPNGNPNVDFGKREIEILKKNNIKIAVSTEAKFITPQDDKLAFPRLGLTYGSMKLVKTKLFLGSYWNRIRHLIRLSELKSRRNIDLLIKVGETLH